MAPNIVLRAFLAQSDELHHAPGEVLLRLHLSCGLRFRLGALTTCTARHRAGIEVMIEDIDFEAGLHVRMSTAEMHYEFPISDMFPNAPDAPK